MNEYLVFCAQRIVYSLYSRAPDQIAYQCRNKNGIAIFQKCLVFLVFWFFSMDDKIFILFTKTENCAKVQHLI